MAQITLKWLFEAEFADGHRISQTQADQSKLDPSKSAFYDVEEYEKKTPLVKFSLGHIEEDKWCSVDLEDGHFELQGVPFDLHFNLPSLTPKFRVIYYRVRTELLKITREDAKPDELEPSSLPPRFMLGWQTTIEDQNYKEVMIIN